MRYGLKSRTTLLLLGLLTLATALTSFVMLSFWLRETASSHAREKELTLTLLAERRFFRFLQSGHANDDVRALLQQALDSTGAIFGCAQDDRKQVVCAGEEVAANPSSLSDLLTDVRARTVVRRLGGRQWVGMVPGKQYLDLAVRLTGPNQRTTPLALRFPLEPCHAKIRSLQRYIAVYLGINLIILAVLGFFRIREMILRPLERLLQLTNSYRDEHGVPFLALRESNELAQLFISMQQMLHRISADREKLHQHVASLEQANQQLRATREEMIRTEKLSSVGRLAAGLAHEIGNPVGIVQGYLGLIRQSDVAEDEREEFCRRAEQELQRISQLVRRLLDLSRPVSGDEAEVDVHLVLNEVVSLLRLQPLMDGIVLRVGLLAQESLVRGNADQLLQVFLNCLINAADAMRAGGLAGRGAIEISTDSVVDDSCRNIRVVIADTGPGLDQDALANAFDPFFTTKEPGKGTGLGLSVSYALIKGMGGKISLANREGGGAVVSIVLPVMKA